MQSSDGKIHFSCNECGTKFVATTDQAGKSGKCKNCGGRISVPLLEEEKDLKTVRHSERFCQECGDSLRSDAKFCDNCSSTTFPKTPSRATAHKDNKDNPLKAKARPAGSVKKKKISIIFICGAMIVFFRIFCGVFVIQPIGAIPDGATIIYWRSGLNMPFIASADGLLDKSGAGVSLLGRGLLIAKLAEPLMTRKVVRFSYSRTLYLWSTGGKEYKK